MLLSVNTKHLRGQKSLKLDMLREEFPDVFSEVYMKDWFSVHGQNILYYIQMSKQSTHKMKANICVRKYYFFLEVNKINPQINVKQKWLCFNLID